MDNTPYVDLDSFHIAKNVGGVYEYVMDGVYQNLPFTLALVTDRSMTPEEMLNLARSAAGYTRSQVHPNKYYIISDRMIHQMQINPNWL